MLSIGGEGVLVVLCTCVWSAVLGTNHIYDMASGSVYVCGLLCSVQIASMTRLVDTASGSVCVWSAVLGTNRIYGTASGSVYVCGLLC